MTPTAFTLCASAQTTEFITIPSFPIHCNMLWPTKAGAQGANRGDITLAFCHQCGHIFNTSFDPALMSYTQDYENSLHFSSRFQTYATGLAEHLIARYGLHGKKIVEIGAGQGDFLRMLCEMGGNEGVGFDPSYVPEPDFDDLNGRLSFIQAYYNDAHANHPADFITCRHVFEHIESPDAFLGMVRRIIGQRQKIVTFFEVPNMAFTLRQHAIWDIIYEHCSYFTPQSLRHVFTRNGFRPLDMRETFGQQFLTIEAEPVSTALTAPDLTDLIAAVAAFAQHYRQKVAHWQQALAKIKKTGKTAVVWGAGSKGVSFLNTLPTQDVIRTVIDINPRKHGMFVAGAGQQIVPPSFLKTAPPDIVILMNPNYQQEIGQTLHNLNLHPQIMVA